MENVTSIPIIQGLTRSQLSRLHFVGVFNRLRIINRRLLSPETINSHDMILLAKNLIQQGYRYLNMTFHSTTLLPGKTPYIRNERQFQSFLHNIEVFLQFAQDRNMSSAPLREAVKMVNGTGNNDSNAAHK